MRSQGLSKAGLEELHEVMAVGTNGIGAPAIGGTEPIRPDVIFRMTSVRAVHLSGPDENRPVER